VRTRAKWQFLGSQVLHEPCSAEQEEHIRTPVCKALSQWSDNTGDTSEPEKTENPKGYQCPCHQACALSIAGFYPGFSPNRSLPSSVSNWPPILGTQNWHRRAHGQAHSNQQGEDSQEGLEDSTGTRSGCHLEGRTTTQFTDPLGHQTLPQTASKCTVMSNSHRLSYFHQI
jgi:hypothetical protein